MPRSLEFTFNEEPFSRELVKVDRRKLYGSVDLETVTMDGDVCRLLTLAPDGRTLIPTGGTAMGYINPDGEWVDRGDLQAVDVDGNPLEELPSSFAAATPVSEEVSIETFLDHSVRLVYRLDGTSAIPAAMLKRLEDGAVFKIPFSYRGGVDSDIGFIMLGEQGGLWLMIAEKNAVAFVGLDDAALCGRDKVEPDDDEDEAEEDALSFDML